MGPYDERRASEEKMRRIWEGRTPLAPVAAVFVRIFLETEASTVCKVCKGRGVSNCGVVWLGFRGEGHP